jgi:D-serine deaminase-like pyridoxal phosphate-dependent protein
VDAAPATTVVGRSIEDLDTPALLVDLAKLERNIATMRRIIVTEAGVGWRPHTKAIKVPALARKRSPARSSARPRSWRKAASGTS